MAKQQAAKRNPWVLFLLLGTGAKAAAVAAGHQGASQVWANEDAGFDRWDLAAVCNTVAALK